MRSTWLMPGSFAVLLVFFATSALADVVVGTVVRVIDGDTLVVLTSAKRQYKVRLAGIDSPESKQAFGTKAKQSLADLAFGKGVTVEYYKTDRYGRIVGKVFVGHADVNLAQVSRGFAWHYKAYEREQVGDDRVAYAVAEVRARSSRVGLWADRSPVPPWEWRRAGGSPSRNETVEKGSLGRSRAESPL